MSAVAATTSGGGAYAPAPDSLEEVQSQIPVRVVYIDGVAALKIVKHCTGFLPSMAMGTLLGLDNDGVLEVTYAFPSAKVGDSESKEDLDGSEYQIEMMKMLRDVNVDNNCVGWYQSMFMGTVATPEVVATQYQYQSSEELSENSVVIMYDPVQSKKNNFVLKAFRLSAEFLALKRQKSNEYLDPSRILQELPVVIRNMGHASAFLRTVQDTQCDTFRQCEMDPFSIAGMDSTSERNLEKVRQLTDDIVDAQVPFQSYTKQSSKPRLEHSRWLTKVNSDNAERRENGEDEVSTKLDTSGLKPIPPTPQRAELLLMSEQLNRYCKQLNTHVENNFQNLLISSQFHPAAKAV